LESTAVSGVAPTEAPVLGALLELKISLSPDYIIFNSGFCLSLDLSVKVPIIELKVTDCVV